MSSAKKPAPVRRSPPAKATAPKVAMTLRLEPSLQEGLAVLHEALKRPVNKLVNEAVEEYLVRQTESVGRDLQALLSRVQAVRKRDPKFKAAVEAFAEAEAQYAKDDPMEGMVIADEQGPAQRAVRALLTRK